MIQHVASIKQVPNKWDNNGPAYEVTLNCGHKCYMTGTKIFNIKNIDCKTCGGTGRDNHFE